MPEPILLLAEYGYLIVIAWVVADQAGLPLPALPVLFAAGVLAGSGSLDIYLVSTVAVAAALATDVAWYAVGRRYGNSMLKVLCKLSMEPDYCLRQAGITFQRFGAATLVASNYIPGLQTVIAPLAGVANVPFAGFLGLRLVGNALWVATFVLPGYLLADRAAELLSQSSEIATIAGVVVVAGLVAFAVYKFVRRQLFLRVVKTGGVHPEELHVAIESDQVPHIVDLRSRRDIEEFPHVIPGAAVVPLEEIDDHLEMLSQKRDLVLYGT